MIICFSCSPETKRQLDELLDTQQYGDYAEAISSAIGNLATIQAELGAGSHLLIGQDSSPVGEEPQARERAARRSARGTAGADRSSPSDQPKQGVPDLLSLSDRGDGPTPRHSNMPSDVWARGEDVPLPRWTFGQYNRLLPVKVACRGLAELSRKEPRGVTIPAAAERLALAATELGDYLASIDQRCGHSRDELLATAFPTTSETVAKSRARFANQFVASVSKQGQLSGLAVDLKLLNWAPNSTSRLQLTVAGWRFALLESPILDHTIECPGGPVLRFSDEEITFLLEHISQHVPAEAFAYRAVLDAISEGANTPSALDAALTRYGSQDGEREFSESFLASQRSGAVSRMTDLRLVERLRSGVRVEYAVTTAGRSYLDNSNAV